MGSETRRRQELTALLAESQEGHCFWCGVRMLAPTFDHRVPASEGGRVELSNGVAAHRACNQARGNRSFEEWCEELGVDPLLGAPHFG